MPTQNKYVKYRYWFVVDSTEGDLKAKSIWGGISTSASQFIGFGMNLVATFILARMLTPEDFGLIGMVVAFTGFANLIKDMGLSMAVIQKEEITHRQVSNLFWINTTICFGLMLLYCLASPLIVVLYDNNTTLYPLVFAYAGGIFLSGLSLQHIALLSRKMKFAKLAKANIAAAILSVICGILAAFADMGYWAIAILNLSLIFFNTCFVWILCSWRPSFPQKNQKTNSFLRFGAGVSGFNIVNYFSRYSDDVLIGSSLGAAAVGFYSKAYQLLMLPINQLRNPLMTVAIPAMSQLRKDAGRYVKYYRKYVFILAFFSMPIVACLGLFSKELILIVLGNQWMKSSQIFSVLALAAFIQPVASSSGLVMITTGQTKKFFIIGCCSSVVTVTGFFIGIHWGVIGTAASFVVTTYAILIPALHFSFKNTPVKVIDFFREMFFPFIHTALMVAILILLKSSLFRYNVTDLLSFFLLIPLGLGLYYFSWKVYPVGNQKLTYIDDVFSIILQKWKKKKSSNKKPLNFIHPSKELANEQ